jgi:oxalate decarboxylase/phosphoglucose isomerase-like protein (cupin superfamily)
MSLPFATRKHEDMKPVLASPNADGPEIHYYMIRGGTDKTNITVWESGNVDKEHIKTYGHYHGGNVRETYRIVEGEGIVLLQQRKIDSNGIPIDDEIETFIAIKVKSGDYVHMPPEFGHVIVNIGKTWLVTIDNTHIRSGDDVQLPDRVNYESVEKMHGFAYYIFDDCGIPKLVKNVNYKTVPKPQWLTVAEWGNLDINGYK